MTTTVFTLTAPQEFRKRKRINSKGTQMKRLIARDGLKCFWCRQLCDLSLPANAPLSPTKDHLVRRADGGTSSMWNLVLACRKCNTSRHAPGWKPPVQPHSK